MRGGTLKDQSLVLKREALGSGRDNGSVFEMNQHPFSGEQRDRSQAKRDKACEQMRHFFPGLCGHDKEDEVIAGT